MLVQTLLSALVAVVLPDPGSIETLTAGETALVRAGGDGYGWVRILEDDYVCLEVGTDPGCDVFVYDATGELLLSSSGGTAPVVSAFSDYWFFVRMDLDGAQQGSVSVREIPRGALVPGRQAEGAVPSSSMAAAYTFVPGTQGRWQVELDGSSSTDLDLEVYGPDMSAWTGSYSLEGRERVSFDALPAETLTVLVSRYGKGGTGGFTLDARRAGDFRRLEGSWTGVLDRETSIRRALLERFPYPLFVSLTCGEPGADVDLYVEDGNGDYLYGASSYSANEALLVPPGQGELVAQVSAWDYAGADMLRFTLSAEPLTEAIMRPGVPIVVRTGVDPPAGFTSAEGGFHVVEALFDKTRNGDVSLFRDEGEPSVSFASGRGDERFLVWTDPGETVWIYPYFTDGPVASACTLVVTPAAPAELSGSMTGSVGPGRSESFYRAQADADAILVIRLRGEERETDLDMLVSGPGYDLTAEGWLSAVDAAGDETVAISSAEPREFGITVYGFDRETEGGYDLSLQSIPALPLAAGSAAVGETWALVTGISGYGTSADVLNRASVDAVEFYTFITDEQGVPVDHVVLLVDDMATADRFRDSLEALLARAGEGDRVVVFFSGHGTQYEPGSGGPEEEDSANEAICLYDDDVDDDWLAGTITSEASAPVLLFLDACHSGGLVNDFPHDSNVLLLTAAREDRSVSERILTPILLEGCRGGADRDRDGWITASELTRYVDDRLQRICPECDAELGPGETICPECGAALKGENSVPRPEQGLFLREDLRLWRVGSGRDPN